MKQYTKNGVIKTRNRIVIKKEGMQILNPTEEMIYEDGWVDYIAPKPAARTKSRMEVVQELVVKQWNERTDINNEEALDYAVIVYPFAKFVGQTLPVGKIISYDNKLWRVRQEHVALDIYPPSLDTASLYEVIEKEHDGSANDPIPYNPPMEIMEGKHYTESGSKYLYLCTRSSGTALSHSLNDLVGVYVEIVDEVE